MLISEDRVGALCTVLRNEHKKIVFTNGCFDILHAGHVRYLQAAREFGDCLIIGLNSDASVRTLKGEGRPVNDESDRAEVLGALRAVDYVVIFSEPTAERLIGLVKPDVYVKGGDYTPETLPESKIAAAYGGTTKIVPLVAGRSSTNIINRINRRNSGEK